MFLASGALIVRNSRGQFTQRRSRRSKGRHQPERGSTSQRPSQRPSREKSHQPQVYELEDQPRPQSEDLPLPAPHQPRFVRFEDERLTWWEEEDLRVPVNYHPWSKPRADTPPPHHRRRPQTPEPEYGTQQQVRHSPVLVDDEEWSWVPEHELWLEIQDQQQFSSSQYRMHGALQSHYQPRTPEAERRTRRRRKREPPMQPQNERLSVPVFHPPEHWQDEQPEAVRTKDEDREARRRANDYREAQKAHEHQEARRQEAERRENRQRYFHREPRHPRSDEQSSWRLREDEIKLQREMEDLRLSRRETEDKRIAQRLREDERIRRRQKEEDERIAERQREDDRVAQRESEDDRVLRRQREDERLLNHRSP